MPETSSPNVEHARLVLCLPSPNRNLVPFSADVDDSPTHLPAVLLKAVPNETQQLGPKAGKMRPPAVTQGLYQPSLRPLPPWVPHQPCPFLGVPSPPSPQLTVSSHRRSSSMWRCCLARLTSQRPPRLFLGSSHMGSMPSWEAGWQINCLPSFKGKWGPSHLPRSHSSPSIGFHRPSSLLPPSSLYR